MKHAFTLIEVLIVVAIIGIIASIAIPNIINNREQSQRQEQAKKDLLGKRIVANATVYVIDEIAPIHVRDNNVKAISIDGSGTIIYLNYDVAILLLEKPIQVPAEKPQ